MPRKSRIDAPGAVHHIISRGIERSKIFRDDADRDNFLDRLGGIVEETNTQCFAWALIPNHFHLLLKTGHVPIATIMRRLLTGYAVSHNRRHRRSGHLFQNRYKSILCQEDAYLLELVRYIHLNPIRAKTVRDIKGLDKHPYAGHSALMDKVSRNWQATQWVLGLFDKRPWMARRRYRGFVEKGISQGKRSDLIGGGLIRSGGGWTALVEKRKAKIFQKSDERILGDGDFVEAVIAAAQEESGHRYRLAAKGYDLDEIASKVCDLVQVEPADLWAVGKEPKRVEARSLLCYWAVRHLGISMTELSRRLNLSLSGVSLSVKRGERIARKSGYEIADS
jgi:REP element-mobilizing transposase RayT